MKIRYSVGDLPQGVTFKDSVAIDTETLGLNTKRDRLCVVQLSDSEGNVDLVHFPAGSSYDAPRLKALLEDESVVKIFHYARFDVATLMFALDAFCSPIICTKIASKIARTYTERHGLKELCRELLSVDISKIEQSSDWGSPVLTDAQKEYAAKDVLHLHALWDTLKAMLEREERLYLAEACFEFLPSRAVLDLEGWAETDIFQH